MLIQHGHNTEFRNPYRYAIRDLIAIADRLFKRENSMLAADLTMNHVSRGAIASADHSLFKKLIEDLQQ
jgi:hypothetical protein